MDTTGSLGDTAGRHAGAGRHYMVDEVVWKMGGRGWAGILAPGRCGS